MASHRYTIENLELNVDAAEKGRYWLILPEKYRSFAHAKEYPLPSDLMELKRLALIPILQKGNDNAGTCYLRRCAKEYRERVTKQAVSCLNIEATEARATELKQGFENSLQKIELELAASVQQVKDRVSAATASLDGLFSLGRQGLEGQMKAHLEQQEWKGEVITARAFRECFRMVFQAVKGLGLPTDEDRKARQVILEELSESMKARDEALAMQAPMDEDKPPS